VEYAIELFDSDPATFGPRTKLAEIWDARNLGWSRYDRLPGKAFFTLAQTSSLLSTLVPMLTHVRIWRLTPTATTEVYDGAVLDYDSTGDDVVIDCFDYLALLSLSRSGYRTMYPSKLLGAEIVSPEWLLAKNATSSPLNFVATGAIEDPLGTDAVTKIKTNNQFGLTDQMRLQLLFDLSEMGRANTTNQVSFDITLGAAPTFRFLKNKGGLALFGLVLGGNVSDYHYLPNWASYRNDLATIGTTIGGGATEVTSKDVAAAAAKGLRQDVFTIKTLLGIVGKATEADQQKAVADRMLKRALQAVPALQLRLLRGTLDPLVGYDIADRVPVEILNGIDSIATPWRLVGHRGLFSEGGEDLSIIAEPVLT
jgi:hypothetical protein